MFDHFIRYNRPVVLWLTRLNVDASIQCLFNVNILTLFENRRYEVLKTGHSLKEDKTDGILLG